MTYDGQLHEVIILNACLIDCHDGEYYTAVITAISMFACCRLMNDERV